MVVFKEVILSQFFAIYLNAYAEIIIYINLLQ